MRTSLHNSSTKRKNQICLGQLGLPGRDYLEGQRDLVSIRIAYKPYDNSSYPSINENT